MTNGISQQHKPYSRILLQAVRRQHSENVPVADENPNPRTIREVGMWPDVLTPSG